MTMATNEPATRVAQIYLQYLFTLVGMVSSSFSRVSKYRKPSPANIPIAIVTMIIISPKFMVPLLGVHITPINFSGFNSLNPILSLIPKIQFVKFNLPPDLEKKFGMDVCTLKKPVNFYMK